MTTFCGLTSIFSLYMLFFHMLFLGLQTEKMLADAVLVFHGVLIVLFIYRTIRNMFAYTVMTEEKRLREEGIVQRHFRTQSTQGSDPTGSITSANTSATF